jgi:hypothetical protein
MKTVENARDPKLQINVEAFEWVRGMILRFPHSYDQTTFGEELFRFDLETQEPECGSACCLAGWLCAYAGKQPKDLTSISIEEIAAATAGITEAQAEVLFEYYEATPAHAVECIDTLIETRGEVIWWTNMDEVED